MYADDPYSHMLGVHGTLACANLLIVAMQGGLLDKLSRNVLKGFDLEADEDPENADEEVDIAEAEWALLCIVAAVTVLAGAEEEEERHQRQFGGVEVLWGEGACSAMDIKEELERHWADAGR